MSRSQPDLEFLIVNRALDSYDRVNSLLFSKAVVLTLDRGWGDVFYAPPGTFGKV